MSVVNVSHVEKYYGNQGNITKALNDISFAVDKQEFTAVMGASGSGKTTLLNVISTIDSVSAGDIQINGQSICTMREQELAQFRKKELGFIFQDFNLLDTLTLQENIALPLTLLKTKADLIDSPSFLRYFTAFSISWFSRKISHFSSVYTSASSLGK